ncbi:MAG: hypothetical protein IPM66_01755 [Acidobacteriota bacterium]|nr:MAG: hypothetical protein IPM66_01755 [Acidobacteriota bacterium]
MNRVGFLFLIICACPLINGQAPPEPGRTISRRFSQLTRASQWKPVSSLRLNFNTHHPQGMVKVGEYFYLSSVEVTQPTRRFPQPQDGFDRDTGAGRGHLFKFDGEGNLVTDLLLGEGTIYHPGGIDYDGRSIWAPVAEYRPDSRSIVYRVDPASMKATEVFRYADHIGGIVHDTEKRSIHGVSWGSRFFYRWKLDRQGRVSNAAIEPEKLRRPNRSFYIDYQDCKFLGRSEMLCSGLSNYRSGGGRFSLGGLELVDLAANRATHQIPVELWTDSGLPMTQNPFWIEPVGRGLRAYFVPEDRQSTMYAFEVDAGK